MELANHNHIKNPLENDNEYNHDSSSINLKLINNEYSIQLDSEATKYLSMKKKITLPISNDDENEMRRKRNIFI